MTLAKSTVVQKRSIAAVLCLTFVAVQQQVTYGQQEPAPASPEQGSPPEAPALQSADQIQALVAPIALYPDALVAQVLSGATFPDQIALAQNWLSEHQNLSGTKLMKEVDKQSWDPSVKALTQFPSVLENMAKNLAWTSELGEVTVAMLSLAC